MSENTCGAKVGFFLRNFLKKDYFCAAGISVS
jgi:hypothetical protein